MNSSVVCRESETLTKRRLGLACTFMNGQEQSTVGYLECQHFPSIDLIWQGSFVSSGQTRLLSLQRSNMEAKLGPLQQVIDQAGARVAKGEAMKEKNEGLAASLKVSDGQRD